MSIMGQRTLVQNPCSISNRRIVHRVLSDQEQDAHASKILLKQDGSSEPTASGVEFLCGDKKYEVRATREVVLSGGVIGTPQLLELSGIGDPKVLNKAGVECIVKNDNFIFKYLWTFIK